MSRTITLVYGIASYTLFLAVFLYLVGFVWGMACRRASTAAAPDRCCRRC